MSENIRKKLYLITDYYPYGFGEQAFLRPEIPYLEKEFDLTIISTIEDENATQTSKVGDKTRVVKYKKKNSVFDILYGAIKGCFDKELYQEIVEIIKSDINRGNRFIDSLRFYIQAQAFYRFVKKLVKSDGASDVIFYTYWFYLKCFAFTNNKNKFPGCKIVTRTHGYDLYNDRNKLGRQPFKNQMDAKLDKIFFVSEFGKEYYLKEFGNCNSDKYIVSKLGIIDQSQKVNNQVRESDFVLVSCSNIVEIKRIDLIIKSLALIDDINISWYHIGDGSLREQMEKLACDELGNKKNLKYHFLGQLDNQAVVEFYANNVVDCFITTSATEGCPVSIQEAMMFSIPIIGTAVGEIPEMIKGNGVLLSENPSIESIINEIYRIRKLLNFDIQRMKRKSYSLFKKMFDAEKNFVDFITWLKI